MGWIKLANGRKEASIFRTEFGPFNVNKLATPNEERKLGTAAGRAEISATVVSMEWQRHKSSGRNQIGISQERKKGALAIPIPISTFCLSGDCTNNWLHKTPATFSTARKLPVWVGDGRIGRPLVASTRGQGGRVAINPCPVGRIGRVGTKGAKG